MRNSKLLFLILLFPFFCVAETPQFDSSDVKLERSEIPAKGKQEAIFQVSRYGRYAITVSSKQGTALQLVDRMAGPGVLSGVAGESNGRIDAFLDRGSYKIIAFSHEKGNDKANLQVHPFRELNSPKPPLLEELKTIHGSLGDFEQISYWLILKEKRNVILEAAGRNLADLRLWKHGTWLIDVTPKITVRQPKVGQPVLTCLITTELEAGVHLLTAYGGPSQPWSIESKEHPFDLRFGVPTLGNANRKRYTMSPFGIDRFLIPGTATYFRLELAEAKPASLQISAFDPKDLFKNELQQTITKKTNPPVAEIQVEKDYQRQRLVSIEYEPGQPYVLQHFELSSFYAFAGNGNYWLSTVHSGHPSDSIDPTAIVVQYHPYKKLDHKVFLAETVPLDLSRDWKRRFNLLEPLTLYLQIREAGKYEIVSEGTKAQFRIEPFLNTTFSEYSPPPFRNSESAWDLDTGYYILTVDPIKKGILTLHLRSKGLINSVLEAVGLGSEKEPTSARAATRFEKTVLDSESNYCIYLNRQPEVKAGVILRKLPLDPTEPLFVSLMPNETASVEIQVGAAGILKAEAEVGPLLQLSKNQDPSWKRELALTPGRYHIKIKNHLADTVQSSLFFETYQQMASTPPPPLPDTALATLPKFAEVIEKQPQYFDLVRNEEKPFLLKAVQPALYQIQTTGLLSTSGNLRTRINPSFLRANANGIGRNFLIQQYLREGDYQVTVSTQGTSQGHAGLQLVRTSVKDGGLLTEELPARVSLSAGEAVLYQFTIHKKGTYKLQSFGIGRTFLCRLEDSEGWPIEQPNIPADLTRHFDAGTYRILLMPEAVSSRRITLLHRIAEPARLAGHGPHDLPLNKTLENVWQESNKNEKRIPDIWKFSLPAPIDAQITLTDEMQADLILIDQNGLRTKVAYIPPQREWKGHLEMGAYQLEASCVRRNNQVSYTVGVYSEQLVAGMERAISIPGIIPLSVGQEKLIELSSFGSVDLRASLHDAAGHLIARNDDRPDDWNFHIARTLKPGNYKLQINPVGTENGTITVAMSAPDEITEQSLLLPAKLRLDSLTNVHLYPLQLPSDVDLLLISAVSAETIGCSVEVKEDGSWHTIGTREDHLVRLEIPLHFSGGEYRMRIWSVDRRGTQLHISTTAISTKHFTEKQFAEGIKMTAVAGIEPPVAATSISISTEGIFRIEPSAPLRWCSRIFPYCQPNSDLPATVTGQRLWLISDLPNGKNETIVRGFREILSSGKNLRAQLSFTRGTIDLRTKEAGPVLVRATTLSGQPAISFSNTEFEPDQIAVSNRSAVAISPGSQNLAAQFWQASEAIEPVEVEIYQQSFNAVTLEDAGWGPWSAEMKGVSMRHYRLPSGNKRLKLTLGSTIVAALSANSKIQSVHWASNEPLEEVIDTAAEELMVFHTRESSDPFAVQLLPGEQSIPMVTFEQPYEQIHTTRSVIRLRVPAGKDVQRLHISGSIRTATLIRKDGKIFWGVDLPVEGKESLVLIEYNPGLLLAWLENAEKKSGLWGTEIRPQPLKLEIPGTVQLAGPIQSYFVAMSKPGALHVRTTSPVIVRLERKDIEPEVYVYEKGCDLDTYLPNGQATLTLRAFSRQALSGTMEITAHSTTSIVEGLGPSILLAPGNSRFFSFSVQREGSIGIGVRAGSDVVDATVWDSSGRKLGKGVVQMLSLKPGIYLLSVHVPQNSTPVSIQPAVAGLNMPSNDPPEDVIRSYLQLSKPVTPGDSIPFVAAPENTILYSEEPRRDQSYSYDQE